MVSGRKADAGGTAAVGERLAESGGSGTGGGNAGNDCEGQGGGAKGIDFLSGASEDERVAGFEAHDGEAAAGRVDHGGVDLLLGDGFTAAALADVDEEGASGVGEDGGGDEIVVKDEVGGGEQARGPEGEEIGIAGTGADKINGAGVRFAAGFGRGCGEGSAHAETFPSGDARCGPGW